MSAGHPAFQVGQRVRVLTRQPTGHFRTPGYVRGRVGVVQHLTGAYLNAETLAHGGDGRPPLMMYRVQFQQPALWPDYAGPATDTLVVDIYEHWLEPAPGDPQPPQQEPRP
ncbi:MAG: nitrile hydratase subunit beta [Deltaproteobacteria bacterium]|nr:nitrile hydratase subunit beta [Deltaproteobacteria bacterium]